MVEVLGCAGPCSCWLTRTYCPLTSVGNTSAEAHHLSGRAAISCMRAASGDDAVTCSLQRRIAIQGDNDPVDVVEIGSRQLETGGVYKVKAIGAYAMIDDGELDWKIVCIRADDPLANKINDIEDAER